MKRNELIDSIGQMVSMYLAENGINRGDAQDLADEIGGEVETACEIQAEQAGEMDD